MPARGSDQPQGTCLYPNSDPNSSEYSNAYHGQAEWSAALTYALPHRGGLRVDWVVVKHRPGDRRNASIFGTYFTVLCSAGHVPEHT